MSSREINPEKVSEFRQKFEEKIDEGLYYPEDVSRIKNDDEYCQRFLDHQNTFEQALSMAKDALKWRKEFDVHGIKESMFPKEVVDSCSMYQHGEDKESHQVLIFHVKKHKKNAELALTYKKFVIYWFEKMEKSGGGKPITVIFDCIGSGIMNLDMDIMQFIVNSFKHHYPSYLGYILVIEMPWILNAAWKIIKLWLPARGIAKIKFVNKKTVLEYMDPSQLLECMGGEDKFEYKFVPSVQDADKDKQ